VKSFQQVCKGISAHSKNFPYKQIHTSKSTLKQKVDDFIQENYISCLNKDTEDTYQKKIQHAIQKMYYADRQTYTEVPDKHKTNGSNT